MCSIISSYLLKTNIASAVSMVLHNLMETHNIGSQKINGNQFLICKHVNRIDLRQLHLIVYTVQYGV